MAITFETIWIFPRCDMVGKISDPNNSVAWGVAVLALFKKRGLCNAHLLCTYFADSELKYDMLYILCI